MSLKLVPTCNEGVKNIIDYCVDHMTDSKAKESLQVCWEKDLMEDAMYYYALGHLDTSEETSRKMATIGANRVNDLFPG